jgi:prevent-host-death family protein
MKNALVGSRELKTRLGTYLEQVKKGKTIVVTDRGKPIAELKPIGNRETTEEDRIAELEALGLVTRKSKAPLASFRPHRMAGKRLSDALLEDREDRF